MLEVDEVVGKATMRRSAMLICPMLAAWSALFTSSETTLKQVWSPPPPNPSTVRRWWIEAQGGAQTSCQHEVR